MSYIGVEGLTPAMANQNFLHGMEWLCYFIPNVVNKLFLLYGTKLSIPATLARFPLQGFEFLSERNPSQETQCPGP